MKVRIEGDRVYGIFNGHYFPQDTMTVRRKEEGGVFIAIEDANKEETNSVALSEEDRIELIKLLGGTI